MEWLLPLTFIVSLLASILSGMSGGGGGFIMIPYYLFAGLSPAQALATSKVGGIGVTVGAVTAFRGKGLVHRRLVIPLMVITFACSLFAAWAIPKIDPVLFQRGIAVVLIALTPTLFIKKAAFQPGARSKPWFIAGFILYTVISFVQSMVGTGLASLLVLVLMFVFGLGALEANATKRIAQAVQSVLLLVLLAIQGLVVWHIGLAAFIGAWTGSHIGGKIVLKHGSGMVKIALAVVMLASGIVLLL